mgnify:CR=1 FL=1
MGGSVHGLRHTWATRALEQGIHPKVVQEHLGHSSIAITRLSTATLPRSSTTRRGPSREPLLVTTPGLPIWWPVGGP